MSFQFCWEYNECGKPCPVRDLKVLYCWEYFAEEEEAGLKPCASCGYRHAWQESEFRAEHFRVQPPPLKGKCRKKTILVIDDEPNILYALEELVSSRGYECISALDGEEGLRIARGIKPDLIISDVIMPKVDGCQLCSALKRDQSTKHIPIILVTVKAREKDRLEGQLAGADAYVYKPFDPALLREKIETFL